MHAALRSAACVGLALLAGPVRGDEPIYSTGGPYGGPMGVSGFDVWTNQSVAIRFTPSATCTLTEVSVWLMANTTAGQETAPTVNISLRGDAGVDGEGVGPAPHAIVNWTCAVGPQPFQPAAHVLAFEDAPVLSGGQHYWIVAESGTSLRRNPVWNWSGQASGFVALRGSDGQWSCAEGVAMAVEVRGVPACSQDYNGDGDHGTDQDIQAFFACLTGSCCGTCGPQDYNQDGDWGTDQDIESFFRVLAGGAC